MSTELERRLIGPRGLLHINNDNEILDIYPALRAGVSTVDGDTCITWAALADVITEVVMFSREDFALFRASHSLWLAMEPVKINAFLALIINQFGNKSPKERQDRVESHISLSPTRIQSKMPMERLANEVLCQFLIRDSFDHPVMHLSSRWPFTTAVSSLLCFARSREVIFVIVRVHP